MVKTIADLESALRHLERKSLYLEDFIAFHDKNQLPLYRVEVSAGNYLFFYNDKEWHEYRDQFVAKEREKLIELRKSEKPTAENSREASNAVEIDEEALEPDMQELWEMARLSKISDQLKSLGLDIRWYDVMRDEKTKPLFKAVTDKSEKEGYSLKDLIETVREAGRSGATIQRYKGLGEMNPDQLWETTMDPKRRKLLKVVLEDPADAELAFTTLMGDKVEPRRAFIERHAKEVKNLDV